MIIINKLCNSVESIVFMHISPHWIIKIVWWGLSNFVGISKTNQKVCELLHAWTKKNNYNHKTQKNCNMQVLTAFHLTIMPTM